MKWFHDGYRNTVKVVSNLSSHVEGIIGVESSVPAFS